MTSPPSRCRHCEGKGFIELRDCTGEIQREETCYYCNGKGYLSFQTTTTDSGDRE